jgi:hypothetical protein
MTTSESQPAPVGAIAGGVIGGVAGIAILAAVAWLLIRRRRNGDPSPVPGNNDVEGYYSTLENAKMTQTVAPQVQDFKLGPTELTSERDHAELAASPTYTHPPTYTNPLLNNMSPVEMDATPTR